MGTRRNTQPSVNMRRDFRQMALGLLLASSLPTILLLTSPTPAQTPEFQKISLRYKDGRTETFNFGLTPYVEIKADTITVHYLKDKQIVSRGALRLICHDACPETTATVSEDTIVWDGRKPLQTKGKIFSDPNLGYLQNGKAPVKNAGFDRVRYIQFGE